MKRMIDDSLFRSPQFGQLDCTAKLLYIGMITSADDQGRLLADFAYLRSLIFPFDQISIDLIEVAFSSLVSAGYIHFYEVNGMPLAQIPHWWGMQSLQYAQPSKYAAPEGWDDHLRFTMTRGVIVTYNWLRKDGTRSPDTCDHRGNPLPSAAEPAPEPTPTPSAATDFKTDWNAEPDRQNDPTRHDVPSLENRVTFATASAKIDPRKFVGGLIPKGKGATPMEVYYEYVNVRQFQVTPHNQAEIVAVVTDLAKWRNVLAEWFGRQYSPGKISCKDGLLDWYKYGIPTTRSATTTNTNGTSHRPQPATDSSGAGPVIELGKRAALGAAEANKLFARRKG